MAVIWVGLFMRELGRGVPHDLILGKYTQLCSQLCAFCPPQPFFFLSQSLSMNPTFFKHLYVFIFLCPAFVVSPNVSMLSHPIWSCNCLFSCPSIFSCCQIYLKTLGKLHFSDYTPIKGPVGTLFAFSCSSQQTKWTVSVYRTCVCLWKKIAFKKSICVALRMSNRRRQPPAKSLLMILFTLVARLIKV